MSSSFLFCSLVGVILLRLSLAFDLATTGSTVTLNGVPYYIPGTPYASRPNFKTRALGNKTTVLGGLVPITVVTTSSVTFNLADLQKTVKRFEESDDVWQPAFLSGMFIE